MTPVELWAAVLARKSEQRLPWWRVAVQMDVGADAIGRLRHGTAGPNTRQRAEHWLRRPAPSRTE
jgi:hypothetical protein